MSTENTPLLHISSSPHIRVGQTVPHIMRDVLIALVPALIAGVVVFGPRVLVIVALAVISAIITEHCIAVCLLKKKTPIGDLSAVVTAVLLAFNLPVGISPILVVLGTVFAIAVVKWTFGGLGGNFVNPALAARAFLLASYPAAMSGTAFTQGNWWGKIPENLSGIGQETVNALSTSASVAVDAITTATPLVLMNTPGISALRLQEALLPLFWGNVGGCIGETSAFALLLGGIFLLFRKIINPVIPLVYIGGVFVLTWILNSANVPLFAETAWILPTYRILAGGLFLGAFFMATDMVTTPITTRGQAVFAAGCALLTVIIGTFGGYPEGVSYSILLMNLVTPLIDRHIRPRIYGARKK